MKRTATVAALSITGLLLAGGIAPAQDMQELAKLPPATRAAVQTKFMSEKLELSPEQKTEVEAINSEVDAIGPSWTEAAWDGRALPEEVPPVVRFGEVRLGLERIPGGVPRDARLRPAARPGSRPPRPAGTRSRPGP